MVDFNPEENIRNLTEEEKELIKQAVKNTYGKMFPNGKSLDYLYSQFKNLIEPIASAIEKSAFKSKSA